MASMTSLNVIEDDKCEKNICTRNINPVYIPLKVIYFTFMAGQAGPVIFRALFIKHLGMSTTQNGIIWAVDRIIGMFVPPILGWISDKSRRPKTVIVWVFLTGSIFCSSLYFIPPEKPPFGHSVQCFDSSYVLTNNTIYCAALTKQSSTNCRNKSMSANLVAKNCTVMTNDRDGVNSGEVINKQIIILLNQEEVSSSSNFKWSCDVNFTNFPSTIFNYSSFHGSFQNNENVEIPTCVCANLSASISLGASEVYGSTFWMLLLLLVISSFSVFGGQTLIDSMILNVFSKKERHNFGLQRMWGGIGYGSTSLLVGYIKDEIAQSVSDPSSNLMFLPVFLSSGIFWFITCVTTCCLKSDMMEKQQNQRFRLSGIKTILKDLRIFVFLLFAITAGYAIAVGEIYMFWLAEQRFNASSTILSLCIAISSCVEVGSYISAGLLIRRFGHQIIMSAGLLILATRVLVYTLVTEAWQLPFAEIFKGLGWPILWISACHHIAEVAPPGLSATTMGVVQAVMFGIGYGLGAMLGGYLFEVYGGNSMFRMSFALISSVSVLYFTFFNVYDRWERRKDRKRALISGENETLKTLKSDEGNTAGSDVKHTQPCEEALSRNNSKL